jgi:heterodisulfide reductase subunit A
MEKTGVYICHCGTNIAGTVDVEAVTGFCSSLDEVTIARDYAYMCSDPGQDLIKEDIREMGLNRVVVASCSPTMHEHTFRNACEEAGLNPFFFQMANIREQCSWVTDDPAKATEKAKRILSAAVHRVSYHEPLEVKEVPVNPAALVVGAGITGIEAALRIADSGRKVYLVEREPSIGGHMAQLDKTFPTLDCSACILTPKMVSVGQHENIELLSYSEVEEVSGYVGNFQVKVRKKARYVDEDLCTGCGLCEEKCPAKNIPSEFNLGLGTRKAIYRPFPQAVPNTPVLDREHCIYFERGKCRACEKLCPRQAIDFEQQDRFVDLEVGTAILATGFDLFDPSRGAQFGYGLDNVLTGLEFERLVNASGPTSGKVLLGDGTPPGGIAILHCIGSRDEKYNEYCSRVCCMYSLKFAHLVREITGAKVYQVYRDMRAFGKGYEEFFNRVEHEGAVFVRRGEDVEVVRQNGGLLVRAEDIYTGNEVKLSVDMVILGVGIEPRRDSGEVARLFGIGCGDAGFFTERHPKLAPVETASDGIFIAGACQGPKDIPDSVAQAGAAAAVALGMIDLGKVDLEPIASFVDEDVCSGCRTCIGLCPYNAIEFVALNGKGVSRVNEALCKGCGTCVSACPSGAATQRGFVDRQIFAEIQGALYLEVA